MELLIKDDYMAAHCAKKYKNSEITKYQSHKKRSSDKKNSSISAHIFLKLVEFYFGKENIFLLRKDDFITKIIFKLF